MLAELNSLHPLTFVGGILTSAALLALGVMWQLEKEFPSGKGTRRKLGIAVVIGIGIWMTATYGQKEPPLDTSPEYHLHSILSDGTELYVRMSEVEYRSFIRQKLLRVHAIDRVKTSK